MTTSAPLTKLFGGPLDGAAVLSSSFRLDAVKSFRVGYKSDDGTPPIYVVMPADSSFSGPIARYFVRQNDIAFALNVRWESL